MSLQEALTTGGETTALGLCIVFAVLAILMLVLMLMEKIFYKKDKPSEVTVAAAVVEAAAAKPADDAELIAVLTAAVAASLNTSTYNLKIKSYRRVDANTPTWRRAGINDTINTRY